MGHFYEQSPTRLVFWMQLHMAELPSRPLVSEISAVDTTGLNFPDPLHRGGTQRYPLT